MTMVIAQQQVARTVPQPQPEPAAGLQIGDRGPDVSSHQGTIDWAAVAGSGAKFAFIKATEGTSYANPFFASAWLGAATHGLMRGSYHYAQPDSATPEAEAMWFLSHAQPRVDDDMLALDIEAGSGDLLDWCLRFVRRVRTETGRKCWLYSGLWFMHPHNLLRAELADACGGLWYASYQGEPPPSPPGWPKINLWQYTSNASVPGVSGPCDESIYLGA